MIAYGARCLWWDDKAKVGLRRTGNFDPPLPCCPHCGGMLFETDEAQWWTNVDLHTQQQADYRAMVEWARGKCFKTLTDLVNAWAAQQAHQQAGGHA